MLNPNRSPITTHVLNLTTGLPAIGLKIRLEYLENSNWKHINQGETNSDGRIENLMDKGIAAKKGTYKIRFETGEYFKGETFYPYSEIVFEVKNNDGHFHVPLLVSPYGLSTYRGS